MRTIVSGARREDCIGEFQQAIGAHLLHDDFHAHEAPLRRSLLAFNLAPMLRIEYAAEAGSRFDLARFQRDDLKAGGRVVKHVQWSLIGVGSGGLMGGFARIMRKLLSGDNLLRPYSRPDRLWRGPQNGIIGR